MIQSKFLNTLFDINQKTCFSSDPYGTELTMGPTTNDLFFSINPMRISRKDENVTCFRNFLIEIDSLPLEEQIEYVRLRVPVTSIVYSGGKSYHFIISLVQPLASIEDYRHVAKRLHMLLPMADKSTKNPSRFSRLPGVFRYNTGKYQELIKLSNRIPNSELFYLLPVLSEPQQPASGQQNFAPADLFDSIVWPDVLISRMGCGRNAFFFWLGNRLDDAKVDRNTKYYFVSEAYSNLKDTQNFNLQEAFAAARIGK